MAAPSSTRAGYTPVEPPAVSVAADGRLAAVHEATRVTMLELPSVAPFAEVSIDPEAVGSEVGWIGTPGRLLVLSRYEAHSTVHLLDPRGPRSIAEIRLEAPMRLFASVGGCALVVGALGAAVVAATETHLTLYPFPTRTVPATAGAAGTQFVVALPGSVEEWDPKTRMPTRRLRLPRAAAITAVGGSERLVWMTTQQEPARIDVIPLMNRGQPRAHDLLEPIGRIASHPRSEMLAVIGAESGRLYAIDLDGRIPTRILDLEALAGIDHVDAAAVLGGRAGMAVVAQLGRPVALVALDRRDAEPAVAALPGVPTISVPMAREPDRAGEAGTFEPERRAPARMARPALDLRAASEARGDADRERGDERPEPDELGAGDEGQEVDQLGAGEPEAGAPDGGELDEVHAWRGGAPRNDAPGARPLEDESSLDDRAAAYDGDAPLDHAPWGDTGDTGDAQDAVASEGSPHDLARAPSAALDAQEDPRSSGAALEAPEEPRSSGAALEAPEDSRSSGAALEAPAEPRWSGAALDAPAEPRWSGAALEQQPRSTSEAGAASHEPPRGPRAALDASGEPAAPGGRAGPTPGLRALRERAAPVASTSPPTRGDPPAGPPSISLGRGAAAPPGPRASLPAMRSSAPRSSAATPTTRPAPFVPRAVPRAPGDPHAGDPRTDARPARPASSASERFSSWRDQVRQGQPRGAAPPSAAPPAAGAPAGAATEAARPGPVLPGSARSARAASAPPSLRLGSPPRPAGGVTFSLEADPAEPGAPAVPDDAAQSWRDEVVAWSRAVLAGHIPLPIGAPSIDALIARLDLAPSLQPVLALLYGAHLCGERGVAPVAVSRLLAHRWDEALGRGELAQHALASFVGSRVALAPVVQRMLDELPPLSGALLGEPGPVALLGPCVAVAGDEPLGAVAARCVAAVGSAILVAHDPPDRAALALEARIYGAVAMRRIADADAATNELTIFVVPTEALAEQLGLPRLA